MDYELKLSDNGRFINITYLSSMTTELALESGPAIMEMSHKHSVVKYLFDMRSSKNEQSATKNYHFANHDVQTFEFPRFSRSAFLVNQDDHSHDFITTVFLNAGYIVKTFTEYEEAVAWLESGVTD